MKCCENHFVTCITRYVDQSLDKIDDTCLEFQVGFSFSSVAVEPELKMKLESRNAVVSSAGFDLLP